MASAGSSRSSTSRIVVALAGFALANNVILACVFYCIYALIAPVSYIGGSTYLRKICAPEDLAASLAMGLTISHATAIAVPVAAGFILNFVGYQIPFYLACGVAVVAFFVTPAAGPRHTEMPGRIAADQAPTRRPSPWHHRPRRLVSRARHS